VKNCVCATKDLAYDAWNRAVVTDTDFSSMVSVGVCMARQHTGFNTFAVLNLLLLNSHSVSYFINHLKPILFATFQQFLCQFCSCMFMFSMFNKIRILICKLYVSNRLRCFSWTLVILKTSHWRRCIHFIQV